MCEGREHLVEVRGQHVEPGSLLSLSEPGWVLRIEPKEGSIRFGRKCLYQLIYLISLLTASAKQCLEMSS